jgi:hypothetical protein
MLFEFIFEKFFNNAIFHSYVVNGAHVFPLLSCQFLDSMFKVRSSQLIANGSQLRSFQAIFFLDVH